MSNENRTETVGCGECDSCLAGYSREYCITQNTDKTNTIPAVHRNDDDTLEY